jgi:hypothetical protein
VLPPSTPLAAKDLVRFLWSPKLLPDLRLFARLILVVGLLLTHLHQAPVALHRALRRGATRFFNNKRISAKLLRVSALRTLLAPLSTLDELVLAHDSSEIDEHGRGCPDDAGPLRSRHARGYMTHWAVAGAMDGTLYGIVDAWAWKRSDQPKADHHERDMRDKESKKWDQGIRKADRVLRASGFAGTLHHAGDREEDIYEHLVHQHQDDRSLVVRADISRQTNLLVGKRKVELKAFLPTLPVAATMTRTIDSRTRHATRGVQHRPREVKLEIRFANVVRCAPKDYKKKAFAAGLPLGLVEIREVDAPADVEPLHWVLWSVQPVSTLEQALRAQRIYECRWGAEEFFFVAKTGCGLESEHVTNLASFERLMAVVMAVATHLVRWVSAAQQTPTQPVSVHVEPETVAAVKQACAFHRIDWPRGQVRVGAFVQVLARLGGHEPSGRKAYGWRVVWRGWARVEEHRAIVEHERERARREEPAGRRPKRAKKGREGVILPTEPACGPT